jgi:hypothetical protein
VSRRIIVRPEGEAEMADALDWYEDRVSGLGSEFLLCVDAVFSSILRSPHQYPRVHKIVRRALTRRFPYEVFFCGGRRARRCPVGFPCQAEPETLAGTDLRRFEQARRRDIDETLIAPLVWRGSTR